MCLCSLCRTLLPKEQEYIFSHNFNLQCPQRTLSCAPNIYLFFPRLARDLLCIIGNCVLAWMCLCVSDWETDTEKRNIFHQQMGIIHAAQVSARPHCTMYSMCEEERKKVLSFCKCALSKRISESHHITISPLKETL